MTRQVTENQISSNQADKNCPNVGCTARNLPVHQANSFERKNKERPLVPGRNIPKTNQTPVYLKIIEFFKEYYAEKERNLIFCFFKHLAIGLMMVIFLTYWSDITAAIPLYLIAACLVPSVYILTLVGELLFCGLYIIYCLLYKACKKIKKFYFFLEDLIS